MGYVGPSTPAQRFLRGFIFPSLVCVLFALTFFPFFCDDALISLRYSQHLLEGEGLVWNSGEYVEGYSNLSWVVLVAGVGYLGVDLILAARLLGGIFMIAVLGAVFWFWHRRLNRSDFRFLEIAQYGYALSATTGVWLIGGLEQPIVAASLSWSVVLLADWLMSEDSSLADTRLWLASLLLGVFCLSRPDSPLVCLCLALAVIWAQGINLRSVLTCWLLALFPLVFVIGQLLYRLDVYGLWVANPALIKVNPTLATHAIGLVYVVTGFLFLGPFAWFSLRAVRSGYASDRYRALALIVLCVVLVWSAYLVFIGGDIFAAFRHFTVPLVVMCIGFPMVHLFFASRYRQPGLIRVGGWIVFYAVLQWFNPATGFARGHMWVWNGAPIANMMHQGWPDKKPLIAVDAAGSLPYFTGYPAVDMLGLNDSVIRHAEPDTSGILYAGHQFGDGAYVYRRQPDLVNFCFPAGRQEPCWKSGREMLAMTAFNNDYRAVEFWVTPVLQSVQWIRINSDTIGIEKQPEQWIIPAYLLQPEQGIVQTQLSAGHQFTVDLIDQAYSIGELPPKSMIDHVSWEPLDTDLAYALEVTQDGSTQLTIYPEAVDGLSLVAVIIHLKAH
ncbi:Uncharacterised protein [BD1-7 clade bacterium]|uniref:Glycosyltransferase RgtA/B/C/D-like domain-containing protein n=1 Tax=BD1-7 clade bacterium TaxID=2029982 RepID=A0A5S9NKZ2_9GAMM|nr:Uncharacterised protein [BD1-7 clade bacterium]CAA0093977.1 Uncharacterised protein [BD1-7 clade bacterium]